ncbi:MAG: LPS export ABC transporter permease LptG [Hyphomicrobiaceae bacterium]|nr:LPS export ABC transporter permease LptG [Hyphomicrobiaceae bacterium]
MIGRTLGVYMARKFTSITVGMLMASFVIVFLVDFVELVRRAVDRESFTWSLALAASLLRVPVYLEQVMPFAVLFGAIAGFLALSRRLELVIIRAAGISVWQFLVPPILVAALLGVIGTTVYNPTAAKLKELSDDITLRLFGQEQLIVAQSSSEAWLRQEGDDGESIMHARQSFEQGARLVDVVALTFTPTGALHERIEAKEARLEPNKWVLKDALVRSANSDPQIFNTYIVSTRLSTEQVRESLAAPDVVPFWKLPRYIDMAQRAGLPAFQYRLQYQSLLARPLLLSAMVLIAATVSLRLFRFGNIGRMVLSGVGAGFVLYVITQLARDLGGVGIVPPVVAAWSPAVVATLMGFTILLHQEDG